MNPFPIDPEDMPEDLKSKLDALWKAELESSMQEAYTQIETMGVENWVRSFNWADDRKRTVLKNMLEWYEEREEYERCALLHKGLQILTSDC